MSKDLKKMFESMSKDGWRVEHGTKHIKCFAPNGKDIITVSATASDVNIVRVVGRDMRRIGYTGYSRYY